MDFFLMLVLVCCKVLRPVNKLDFYLYHLYLKYELMQIESTQWDSKCQLLTTSLTKQS